VCGLGAGGSSGSEIVPSLSVPVRTVPVMGSHQTSETPPHRLAWLAAQLGPEAEEVFMSTADTLRAEGRVEGRAEGEVKGAARTLVRLLTRRFTTVHDEVRARIEAASLEQLDIWSDRVLDAATLDDVFR
jgi:Domain of unknown function (DUF4351)